MAREGGIISSPGSSDVDGLDSSRVVGGLGNHVVRNVGGVGGDVLVLGSLEGGGGGDVGRVARWVAGWYVGGTRVDVASGGTSDVGSRVGSHEGDGGWGRRQYVRKQLSIKYSMWIVAY